MKRKLIVLVTAMALIGGCSSTFKKEDDPSTAPINSQKLTTGFKRQGIKIEWDCVWGTGMFDATCVKTDIKSIEVTGYAPSFGNSEVLREQAFKVAHDVALDKLIRFVKQEVSSTRVTNTMSKNIEKAQDNVRNHIKVDDVSVTDDEAAKDGTLSSRQNVNETVRTITETIRTNAQGIVRGARTIDEGVVDRQTVSVTIRWDTNSEKSSEYLRKRFVTN